MRRAIVVTMLAVFTLLLVIPGSAASQAEGPEVIRGSWPCQVGWSDATVGTLGSCEVVNVRTGSGGYVLTLRGQIPAAEMEAWRGDGAPRAFATQCLANWRFWVNGEDGVVTDSVRRFNPRGQMIEVCTVTAPAQE
jgi:hypothetical protein